jgi:hypothetical protein
VPTASEFDSTAREFDEVSRWAGGPLSSIGFANQHVCIGGHLAGLIQRTIDDACQHVRVVVESCGAAADTARQRAADCRRYTDAMVDYRAAMDRAEQLLATDPSMLTVIDWPIRPIRPGPWAEEG